MRYIHVKYSKAFSCVPPTFKLLTWAQLGYNLTTKHLISLYRFYLILTLRLLSRDSISYLICALNVFYQAVIREKLHTTLLNIFIHSQHEI